MQNEFMIAATEELIMMQDCLQKLSMTKTLKKDTVFIKWVVEAQLPIMHAALWNGMTGQVSQ